MSKELVTGDDIAQALSQTLIEVSMGRNIKKSKLQNYIDIAGALDRRVQTKINLMKVMIEAKRSGIDFAASMKEISAMVKETGESMGDLGADDPD